jgi:chromosome segregation ATPase
MKTDLRAFRYEADAILQQRRWQLDAAVAELGRRQGQLAAADASLSDLRAQMQAQCGASLEGRLVRIDPQMHVGSLQWLAQLQGRIDIAIAHRDAIERERDAAGQRLRELQCKVDALEAHREDAVAEFAVEQASRDAAQADRDWLAMRPAATLRSDNLS